MNISHCFLSEGFFPAHYIFYPCIVFRLPLNHSYGILLSQHIFFNCISRIIVTTCPCFASAVLSCSNSNCVVVLTDSQGTFTSPCYPQVYPKSQACKWTLQAPAGFIVQITFFDFDLEEALGCIYDRVIVNTGNQDVKFCGLTANGLTLNSTSNVMEMSFNSDFSVQKKGFNVSYRQVAVALRNQKVMLPNGNGKVVKVSNSVTIPTLQQFTVCFEVARSNQKNKETIFSYTRQEDSSGDEALSFGMNQDGMALVMSNETCLVDSILNPSDFTSTMKPFCLTWASTTGMVTLYYNSNYRTKTCPNTSGRLVGAGGLFRLGGKNSFDGTIYNFRLWDNAMSMTQLAALTCDAIGNVIDWDNSFWDIPSSLAQTDRTLSCSEYPNIVISFAHWYVLFMMTYFPSAELQWCLTDRSLYIYPVTLLPSSFFPTHLPLPSPPSRYTCRALLVYKTTTNVTLGEAAISTRMGRSGTSISNRLELDTVAVQSVENCTGETPLHYIWPESRPTVTQYIPCFPNKDQTASRTCVISPLNYTAFWCAPDLRNCIAIDNIKVSAENAAEVALQLDNITNNELSADEVFKVVGKVKELVKVAKINTHLAKTVVSILSNVMTSSVSALVTSSATLKTVDELVQKIEFDGPTENITSKNLALGISAFKYSKFNGTSFSAFIHPNSTDLQIAFKSDQLNPLAQVTLPATLLNNQTLTNEEIAAVSRINFMFFRKTGLFQDKQDELSLNSYVVASSVGNYSISNLQDPVEIEIAHLNYQTKPKPTCMFWDFTMKNGTGGWNSKGCRVSPMSNRNKTICLCDHLTHFGILMDISGSAAQIDEKNTKILTFITYIGCGISAIFSAATLLTYIAFEKLRRDYPSKILMNLSTSLLFLNMVFLLDGWLASFDVEGLCVAVAVFLHFFLLTSFTWMGLESIHMYIALVKVFNTYIRRYILKFCIVGWGLPAAIVAIVVAFDKNSYGKMQYGMGETGQGSSEFCWIRSQVVFYVTCVGYFSVLFLLNVAMFIVVMIQICGRNGKRSNHTLREEMLRNLRSVISLTFLLGMTWGFAFFAWGPVNLAFMYLFSIFNSLQGLFIFIFHCALKENVQKQWRRYLCFGRFRLSDNSDWSKTATNNTKKACSDTARKSLSSSSFVSSTANWTSKAKATLNPFAKCSRNAGKTLWEGLILSHTQPFVYFQLVFFIDPHLIHTKVYIL
uniref:Adhesion G-protein coupled receptor G6 n=1 Tax=Oncorhynchus kisutch TaxID=8019 RepID=A0A8C7GR36_ONCKI